MVGVVGVEIGDGAEGVVECLTEGEVTRMVVAVPPELNRENWKALMNR